MLANVLTAACALACGIVIGLAYSQVTRGARSPYARWLGRTCYVRPIKRPDKWRKCVCVAVSWHGAICVRDADRLDEGNSYWIKKQNVEWRVRWGVPFAREDENGL